MHKNDLKLVQQLHIARTYSLNVFLRKQWNTMNLILDFSKEKL